MTSALRITVDGDVTDVDLPSDQAAQHSLLKDQVGGDSEATYYHRATVLHLHSEGARLGLPPNITSWTLACTWRRMNLGFDYLLRGPVIVTGAYGDDGAVGSLPDEFAAQVRTAAATVREAMQSWRERSPVSSEAALAEVLAYVQRDLVA